MAAFDTLSASRDLEDAGMERRQAEAVAHAVASAGAAGRDDLATKADLLKTATKADLADLKAETKTGLEQLRAETRAGLADLKAETKAGLEQLRTATEADLKAGLAALEARMTWRLVLLAGVIVAAVKLIPGP